MQDISIGQKFGYWEVISRAAPQGDNQGARWVCRCMCGVTKLVRAVYLRNGRSTNCGCLGKLDIEKNKVRFYSKIGTHDADTGCWPWIGPVTRGGYGNFFFMGKQSRASRVSYKIHKGEIPSGMVVCHKCDNPKCVNPDHLFLGSHKDNIADMLLKGRGKKGNPNIAGENNKTAKLSVSEIIEIRRLSNEGVSKAEIGRMFGIRDSHVCKIVQRKSWAHVP